MSKKKKILILVLLSVITSCELAYNVNDLYNKKVLNVLEGNIKIDSIFYYNNKNKVGILDVGIMKFSECTTNTRKGSFTLRKNVSIICGGLLIINNIEYFINNDISGAKSKRGYVTLTLGKKDQTKPDPDFEKYAKIIDGEYFMEVADKKTLRLKQTFNIAKQDLIMIVGKYQK